jgi:hypothetical protein
MLPVPTPAFGKGVLSERPKPSQGSPVQPIHGYYLYTLGSQLHPVTEIPWNTATWANVFFPILRAMPALNELLHQSIYQVRTCRQDGLELIQAMEALKDRASKANPDDKADAMEVWKLVDKTTKFEAVLRAELGTTPMYYVSPKNNMDVAGLISFGHLSFPGDLASKAPEAIPDAQQAAKCIAFELSTAAGFHLHRANESVLRRYFDHVAGAEHRPESRNIGDYLNKLGQLNKGDPRVRAALRDLKDLHRNPLMHPEEHIASVDDAISLMGSVRAAMSLMLKELPTAQLMTAEAIAAIFGGQQGTDNP